ncbi:MAG: SDR family NAD(P)-dependent oxidoreductase [Nitrosopumilus sp.]|nr:SDR family NAD(P)-dependent oxidoreductase [Nitrosopumilus sp.]
MHENDEMVENNGRVVIVTGSSKGIGKDIAKELAINEYSVVMNAKNPSESSKAIDEVARETKEGKEIRISSIVGDISKEQTSKSLIGEAITKFRRIDTLINNVGISGSSKKITDLSVNDWNEVIDTNLKSAFLCTKEALEIRI